MEDKKGRTFWDLVHENRTIQYSIILIIILIILGVVFFLSKGYSISTKGITPPIQLVDTADLKKDSILLSSKQSEILANLNNEKINSLLKITWFIVFLICFTSIVSILINAISNSRSKRNIYIGEPAKKVEVFEHIYKMFNKFSLYDRDQSQNLLIEIQTLSKYNNDNGLYIDKQLTNLINDFTDYFKEVIVDYRKKDFSKEQGFQNRFKSLFN
jgi:hypothetical protein